MRSRSRHAAAASKSADKETPGIPPSHFIKARFALLSRAEAGQGQTTRFKEFVRVSEVAGNRYECRLCHAQQAANAGLLVENGFEPEFPAAQIKDALDGLPAGGKY